VHRWHWREIEVLLAADQSGEGEARTPGLQMCSQWTGFPGADYFDPSIANRLKYHQESLVELEVLEARTLEVGEWAFDYDFNNLREYPREGSDPKGWQRAPLVARGVGNFNQTNLMFIFDFPSRMPFWESFVAEHNASERAAKKTGVK
jgi:hypothetical protein